MRFSFVSHRPENISLANWQDWRWQMRSGLKSAEDFSRYFKLTPQEEQGFSQGQQLFNIRVTPYYASLANPSEAQDPIRKIFMPHADELSQGSQSMLDPLAEREHRPVSRIIHRYSDRVLFLVTDFCGVYCRYCTRKHFTGQDAAFLSADEFVQALDYIRCHAGIREVILSGGDPLTLSTAQLEKVLSALRAIEHIEIIRLGTRMPVVNPMRVDTELVEMLKKYQPVYMMTHFNHPREITLEASQAVTLLANGGIPLMNQMVLLKGINNHPAIVQALSRRLLYLRVKPYYMFQCDPSQGTDHLRISIEEAEGIQRELWGHLSGLAMPSLALDIPNGGGKVALYPNFEVERSSLGRSYMGWDGREGKYVNPQGGGAAQPVDVNNYLPEWESLKAAKQA